MDDVEKVPYMAGFADELDLAPTVQWLKDYWL
jgi:hypothetical protein